MTEKELKLRTRKFAINILNFVDELPNRRSANIIGNQLGSAHLLLQQIIGQHAGAGRMQSLLQKLVLLKRKPTNLHSGWI